MVDEKREFQKVWSSTVEKYCEFLDNKEPDKESIYHSSCGFLKNLSNKDDFGDRIGETKINENYLFMDWFLLISESMRFLYLDMVCNSYWAAWNYNMMHKLELSIPIMFNSSIGYFLVENLESDYVCEFQYVASYVDRTGNYVVPYAEIYKFFDRSVNENPLVYINQNNNVVIEFFVRQCDFDKINMEDFAKSIEKYNIVGLLHKPLEYQKLDATNLSHLKFADYVAIYVETDVTAQYKINEAI